MMHPFVIGTILAQPGEPGFPWQWDAFGGGPGKNGGNASASMYPVSDGTPHPKQKAGHYYEPWAPTYNTSGRMNGDSGMLPSQNDWEDVWRVTSGNGFGGPGDDLNINPLAHY
eukprot:Tamp_25473.p4 GENE.Tamp_25473~~Tamp_25473.p4  ORF type:complete len:124 (-),score=24.32 Tamp_25473:568-906(-)